MTRVAHVYQLAQKQVAQMRIKWSNESDRRAHHLITTPNRTMNTLAYLAVVVCTLVAVVEPQATAFFPNALGGGVESNVLSSLKQRWQTIRRSIVALARI